MTPHDLVTAAAWLHPPGHSQSTTGVLPPQASCPLWLTMSSPTSVTRDRISFRSVIATSVRLSWPTYLKCGLTVPYPPPLPISLLSLVTMEQSEYFPGLPLSVSPHWNTSSIGQRLLSDLFIIVPQSLEEDLLQSRSLTTICRMNALTSE